MRLVLALNIEGVLVRQLSLLEEQRYPDSYAELPWGASWVQDHKGIVRLLQTVPEVISELNEIAGAPGVQVIWNTPWLPWLPRIIEQAFGGKLSNGVGIRTQSGYRDSQHQRLLAHLEQMGDPPLVWCDPTITRAHLMVPGFRDGDVGPASRLLIEPDPEVGLTLDDTTEIHDFVDSILERGDR